MYKNLIEMALFEKNVCVFFFLGGLLVPLSCQEGCF